MSRTCLVCNGDVLSSDRFNTNTSFELDTLSSTLTEILGQTVEDVTNVVCQKCQELCLEYQTTKTRLEDIKADIMSQYKATQKQNEDYIITSASSSPAKSVAKSPLKKVVLPASKLQPLPPNYVINVGRLGHKLMPRITSISAIQPTINLKVTVGSDVLTQRLTTTTVKTLTANNIIHKALTLDPATSISEPNSVSIDSVNTIESFINTSPTLSLDMSTLPKDFLASSEEMKKEYNEENNDEQPMEIDEDCTLVRVTKDNLASDDDENKIDGATEYYEMPILGDGQDELVLRELRVLPNDDDDEHQTIVMSGESSSILRVMSRQKLVYEGGEISLVTAGHDDDDDDDGNDHDTGNDSNDESQIELQVSGDEETANAIIAAAQEQGGAFIKVESGEMFRVKSVQSKPGVTLKEEYDDEKMVTKEGDTFKCLLCVREGVVPACSPSAAALSAHVRAAHAHEDHERLEAHVRPCTENSEPTTKQAPAERGKIHECTVCKKKYSSRTLLGEHMNSHSGARPYECAYCQKTFASKYTHQAHLKTHLDRPRPFKCPKCSKCFLTQQNLNQHERTHSGIKEFICKVCGKAFGTLHNLSVHGVVHSGARAHSCPRCHKAFARRAELRDHARTHTGERPFACAECGARFAQRSNLHSHRRATHLGDRRYACDLCPKKFKRRRLLEYHIKASHTGERSLVCEVCSATFVYPEHYKKHLRIHSGERPFVCEVCGKSFNSRDNRNTHRFVHSDKKPYECLVCAAGFMRKQLLYAHMNTSGHLAESIVVNQPRVQKVTESVITTQEAPTLDLKGNKLDVIFETAQEIDLNLADGKPIESTDDDGPKLFITNDKKLLLQDGKSVINISQDGMDPTLVTFLSEDVQPVQRSAAVLQAQPFKPLDTGKTDMTELLQGFAMEHLTDPSQVPRGGVKLVQVQLDNGATGWVALDG